MTTAPDRDTLTAQAAVLAEVAAERRRQTAKHGDQRHLPDGTGPRGRLLLDDIYLRRHGVARADLAEWAKARTDAAHLMIGTTFEHILTEEWAEAMAESDPAALRAELIQVAAVAVQWVEAIDHRSHLALSPPASTEPEATTREEWGVRCARRPEHGVMEASSETEARRWLVHDEDTLMKRLAFVATPWVPVDTEGGEPE